MTNASRAPSSGRPFLSFSTFCMFKCYYFNVLFSERFFKMNVNSVAACVRFFLFDTSFRYVQQYWRLPILFLRVNSFKPLIYTRRIVSLQICNRCVRETTTKWTISARLVHLAPFRSLFVCQSECTYLTYLLLILTADEITQTQPQ